MAQLNKIPQFEGIGAPGTSLYDKDQICTKIRTLPNWEYCKWTNPDNVLEAKKRGPFGSVAEHIQKHRHERYNSTDADKAEDEESYYVEVGFHKVVDVILSHPVLSTDAADGFVLQHSALDLQNTLVDEPGKVMGILN